MKFQRLFIFQFIVCAAVSLGFTTDTWAAMFSLEVAEPALHPGDIGTLRVVYDGGLEGYSFQQGGLDLKLNSSNSGVIKFLDAQILNNGLWDIASVDQVTDDSIGRLFSASLFTPGLAGTGQQTYAEIRYSLLGSGFTDLLLEGGASDPVVHGPLGDVSRNVFSQGACLGNCSPDRSPVQINIGEAWANSRPVTVPPVEPQLPPVIMPVPPTSPGGQSPPPAEPDPFEPEINYPTIVPRTQHPAQLGVFSLDVVEPAAGVGGTGRLRVMYDGGPDGYAFSNGGIGLKLTSSNPGVIKFTDAQIANDDGRWSIATARGISDDVVSELLASSVMTPGLSSSGPQVFAEIEFSLLGEGFTDLTLDIQGEDPLVDGSWGDVSEIMRSRGACLGDCIAGSQPVEINLGESWARLKAEMFPPPPPVVHWPPVEPVINEPVMENPAIEVPGFEPPVPEEPMANDPVATDPTGEIVIAPGLGEIEIQPSACLRDVCISVWIPSSTIDLDGIISGIGLLERASVDLTTLSHELYTRNGILKHLVDGAGLLGIPVPIDVVDSAFDLDGNAQLFAAYALAGANTSDPGPIGEISVPEPGTMLLVGLMTLGFCSRRAL